MTSEANAPTTESLPIYSRFRICPKCEFGQPLTEHHKATSLWRGDGQPTAPCGDFFFPSPFSWHQDDVPQPTIPEHMHRTCPNCRHEWVERPIDAVAS